MGNLISKKIFGRPLVIFSFLLLIFATAATLNEMRRRHSINTEIKNLREEIAQLEQQNYELSKLLSYMKTESFIERESKEKLGFAKPGEKVVVVPGAAEIEPAAGHVDAAEKQDQFSIDELSNPHRWWVYFFGQQKNRR